MIPIAPLVILLAAAGVAAPPPVMDDCNACHEDAVKAFVAGTHGRAMAAEGADTLARSCAACHEPKSEHFEAPSAANVTRVPKDDACATCHAGSRERLLRSGGDHTQAGVGCLACHAAGHVNSTQASLLSSDSLQLCGSCHAVQRASFELPYAHRDGRTPLACTECHSMHGRARSDRLSVAPGAGACSNCHGELTGPRVFEHAAQQVSGCAACHENHGSTNPRLLKRRDMASLCLECHAAVPQSHDLAQAKFRACTSCHVAIHGSDRDPRFFDQ